MRALCVFHTRYRGTPPIFLTTLFPSTAVAFYFCQYEKLLRYGKLANSYRYASETLECVFFVLHLLKVGSK